MDSLSRAQAEIRAVLAHSSEYEDARHAEDTLAWLLRLKARIEPALALAALGHDIDHANRNTRARREDFESLDAFNEAHAGRAAAILRALLEQCDVSRPIVDRACWLVEHHETGGDAEANLLRDADNLSWLRVSLPLYLKREGKIETLRRCRWGYACLSSHARRLLPDIRHSDPSLDNLLREAVIAKSA